MGHVMIFRILESERLYWKSESFAGWELLFTARALFY
jgi:hypothetical protein